ncbi:hypothetical protein PROFUN_03192 [Planoprotostelium fungivorum]|uniref:START domain-containing protein n=1 Tax=Planoprotostelium fungivorum TaxID=1890364 RepID=A0A2P6NWX8_9EUKA|nr:hypothetical protein PROFUN_03192 [Planoprotostelium fungivorum]
MKRQKTEMLIYPHISPTILTPLVEQTQCLDDSTDKAVVIIGLPESGMPYVQLIDDLARVWLSGVLPLSEQISPMVAAFWRSVQEVGRGGQKKEEELCLSGQELHLKYRRTTSKGEVSVIITLKKATGKGVRSQSGIPSGLSSLVNIIEDNVIGRMLCLPQLTVSLTNVKTRGFHTFLAVCPNFAAFRNCSDPYDVRGRTPLDFGISTEESCSLYDAMHANLDPVTKTGIYTVHMQNYPGLSFCLAIREVSPGIFFTLAVIQNHTAAKVGPSHPTVAQIMNSQIWKRNHWDEIMENCLHYVNVHRQHASKVRLTVPANFVDDPASVFCYAYAGETDFLPSGNTDGFWWKSSRGTVSSGDTKRKYHYVDLPDGKRLRRRVMWKGDIKGLCMVEYRHFDNSSTESDKLMGPECMEWSRLLEQVYTTQQYLTSSFNKISAHFDMGDVRTEESFASEHVESYVNSILSSWASGHMGGSFLPSSTMNSPSKAKLMASESSSGLSSSLLESEFQELESTLERVGGDIDVELLSQKLYDHFSSTDRVIPLVNWLVKREMDRGGNFSAANLSTRTLQLLLDSDLAIKFAQNTSIDLDTIGPQFFRLLISSIDDTPVSFRRIILTIHQCTESNANTQPLPTVASYYCREILVPFLHSQQKEASAHALTIKFASFNQSSAHRPRSLKDALKKVSNGNPISPSEAPLVDSIREWFDRLMDEKEIITYERLIACSSMTETTTKEEDQKFTQWLNRTYGPSSALHDVHRTLLHRQLLDKMDSDSWRKIVDKPSENFSFYKFKEEGIPLMAGKTVAELKLSLEEAAAEWNRLIWDPEEDDLIKSYHTEPTANGTLLAVACLKLPSPFQNRIWSYYIDEVRSEKKIVRLNWNAPHPPTKGTVVGYVHLQGEMFEEVKPGITRVTSVYHGDVKGNFPEWLANLTIKQRSTKYRKVVQKMNRDRRLSLMSSGNYHS